MEGARGEGADAHRREHVAKLRDSRIREHPLDVVLHEADGRSHEGRQHADNRDNRHHERRLVKEDGVASHHVDAGGHHGRRVDQGGHRCRPFHRVRQPDI